MDELKNEISVQVEAKEAHAMAQSYYSVAEEYAYKFYMELKKIRDGKLFRELGHETFEEYCNGEWGISRITAYEKINLVEAFEEPEFVRHAEHYGQQKSLFLARMEPTEREEVITEGIPTDAGNVPYEEATRKEIEEYRRQLKAAKQSEADAVSSAKAEKEAHEATQARIQALNNELTQTYHDLTEAQDKASQASSDDDVKSANIARFEAERRITELEEMLADKKVPEPIFDEAAFAEHEKRIREEMEERFDSQLKAEIVAARADFQKSIFSDADFESFDNSFITDVTKMNATFKPTHRLYSYLADDAIVKRPKSSAETSAALEDLNNLYNFIGKVIGKMEDSNGMIIEG